MAPVSQRKLPFQREMPDAEGQQNRIALHGFGTVPFDRGNPLHRQLVTAGKFFAAADDLERHPFFPVPLEYPDISRIDGTGRRASINSSFKRRGESLQIDRLGLSDNPQRQIAQHRCGTLLYRPGIRFCRFTSGKQQRRRRKK